MTRLDVRVAAVFVLRRTGQPPYRQVEQQALVLAQQAHSAVRSSSGRCRARYRRRAAPHTGPTHGKEERMRGKGWA